MSEHIIGSGGGQSGGSSHTPVEAPDSLQSKALLSIVDVVSEGEVGGLVDGAKSILFNGTPLMNNSGGYNFKGVTWDWRSGSGNQLPMGNFSEIGTPRQIGVQVKYGTPSSFSVTNLNVDEVSAIVTIPALYVQDKSSGDINGTSVSYKFEVSVDGGAYQPVITGTASFDAPASTVLRDSGKYPMVDVTGYGDGYSGVSSAIRQVTFDDDVIRSIVVQAQYWDGATWVDFGSKATLDESASQSFIDWNGRDRTSSSDIVRATTLSKKMRWNVISYTENGVSKPWTSDCASLIVAYSQKYVAGTATITVTGKSSAKYQREHTIPLPKTATSRWDIRMVRLTADKTDSSVQNDTYLESITEVIKSRLSYPNTAVFGITIDSSLFSQTPERSYLIYGLKIKVPSNYNPKTRVYSGFWDGSFINAVSDNPAWILYDLLTSKRYGLGEHIQESQIDKAALYSIGKYCDELVPSGVSGEVEPRFTINTQLTGQTEAYKLLCDICSVFRGMIYWNGGMVGFTYDAPSDPVLAFATANVKDGLFNYTGSARRDRHSVVLVTWNNPKNNYKQEIEYVESPDLIAKFGVRQVETVAFGCTSRTQARRVGLWILYTEEYESSVVSFSGGQEASTLLPGSVVKVSDPVRTGKRMAGRLAAFSPTSATVDSPVTIAESGATISIRMDDGTFVDRVVKEGPGTHDVFTWDAPILATPVASAIFIIAEVHLVPILVRVMSVKEQNGWYDVTGVEHNPEKYAKIERGQPFSEPYTDSLSMIPGDVSGLIARDTIYRSSGSVLSRLTVSWDSTNPSVKAWRVRYRTSDGSNWTVIDNILSPSIDIDNVTDGKIYVIECYAINLVGNISDTPAVVTHTVLGKSVPPSSVTNFKSSAAGGVMSYSWDNIPDVDLKEYEVRFDNTGWGDGIDANIAYRGIANSFSVGVSDAIAQDSTLYIRAVDTSGNYSFHSAQLNVAYSAPSTPALSYSISDTSTVAASAKVTWQPCFSDFPIVRYDVTVTKPGKTPVVVSQASTTFDLALDYVGSAEVSVIAVDSYDKQSDPGIVMIESIGPGAISDQVEFVAVGFGMLKMSWKPSGRTTLPIAGYEVRKTDANWGGEGYLYRGIAMNCALTDIGMGDNIFYIKAFDTEGRYSEPVTMANYNYTGPKFNGVIGVEFVQSTGSAMARITWPKADTPFGIDTYHVTLTKPDGSKIENTASTTEWIVGVNWIGTATVTLVAKDNSGNESDALTGSVTRLAPGQIGNVTMSLVSYANKKMTVKFDWNDDGVMTTLPIAGYEIRSIDSGFGGSGIGLVYRGASNQATVSDISTVNDTNFYIRAYDSAGAYSATSYVIAVLKNVGPEPVTTFTAKPVGSKLRLDWNDPVTSGGDVKYEVRTEDANWGTNDSKRVYYGSASTCDVQLDTLGTNTFYVRVLDRFWHWSMSASVSYDYVIPAAASLSVGFGPGPEPTAILTWPSVKTPFGVSDYEVTYGSKTVYVKATTLTVPATWTGACTFTLRVRDVNNLFSDPVSNSVTIAIPESMTVAPSFKKSAAKADGTVTVSLSWNEATRGSLPIAAYEIRSEDANWGTGNAIYYGRAPKASIPGVPVNSISTWYLRPVDLAQNYALNSLVMVHDGMAPPDQVTGAIMAVEGTGLRLMWDKNPEVDVVEYEVRTTDTGWGGAGQVYRGLDTTFFVVKPPASGATYYIRAKDAYGRRSATSAVAAFSYVNPSAPFDFVHMFNEAAGTISVDWPDVLTTFGIAAFKVSYYDSVAGKSVTATLKSSTHSIKPNWVGDKTVSIVSVDVHGVESAPITKVITINPPGVTPDAIKEVVSIKAGKQTLKLDWNDAPQGSFKVAGYEVRTEDANWGTATNPTKRTYKGNATQVTISNVSTTAATTWYIRAFDVRGNYCQTTTVVGYSTDLPNDPSSVTIKRVKDEFELKGIATYRPSDFSHFEFRVGKVTAGATSGDDTGVKEGVVATGDFWNDPDVVSINSTETNDIVRLRIDSFAKPLISKTGVKYRVACKMVDKSGNRSANAVYSSIIVKSLS